MKLDPIGELLTKSWREFRKRFWTGVQIFAVPMVLLLISELLFIHLYNPIAFVLGILIYLLGVIASITASLALITLFGKGSSFAESYQNGFKLFWASVWVAILMMLAVMGGLIMLIIPGIMLLIQLGLANYVMVLDGKRGMAALTQSRAYVKGYWWALVGRILLLILFFLVAELIILIPLKLILGTVAGLIIFAIFVLCVVPFCISYQYEIFENLRRVKPNAGEEAAKAETGFLKVAMVVGIVGVILWFALLCFAIFFSARSGDNSNYNYQYSHPPNAPISTY